MVSWGLITIVTASIQTAHQLYVARLLLGAAEASFFPAIIIYVTRWFTLKDRARAIAAFYAASAVSTFVGSAIASWLLPVHWIGVSGWRWLFVVEGVPAVVLGVTTLFYLTDRPSEAAWLPEAERSAILAAPAAEHAAKTKLGVLRFWDACKDARLLLLVAGIFSTSCQSLRTLCRCQPFSSGFRTSLPLLWQDWSWCLLRRELRGC